MRIWRSRIGACRMIGGSKEEGGSGSYWYEKRRKGDYFDLQTVRRRLPVSSTAGGLTPWRTWVMFAVAVSDSQFLYQRSRIHTGWLNKTRWAELFFSVGDGRLTDRMLLGF